MQFFLFSHVILKTDDSKTIFIKKVLVLGSIVAFIGYIFTVMLLKWDLEMMGAVVAMIALFSVFAQLIIEKRLRLRIAEVSIYFLAAGLLAADLFDVSYGTGDRAWPFFVIMIDVCLVCRMPSRVARNLIIMLVLWLLLILVESTYRFGLYDIRYLSSQEDRLKLVTCPTLPCRLDLAESFENTQGQIIIILLDFYFTRRFAYELYAEHEKMNNVVTATEDIATSLSRFDLEAAEDIISTASLPPPLYDAFSKILDNLKGYRPYIPDALFHSMHSDSSTEGQPQSTPVPGLNSQRASLVFTDIQGSTATWEACPEGMQEGLQIHNKAIRDCIAEHNGYEVKTIGDSFMVAFESTSDAVWFGLSVQERLLDSVWPADLLSLECCSWRLKGPWCGLRVRVGVHCGDVSVQLNNLTGRYDYFGNTVNKAARMEGVCVGGAVAVTPEVLHEVGPLERVASIPMGPTELKGVRGFVNPFILLPYELLGRKDFVEQQLLLKMEDRTFVSTKNALSITSSFKSWHSNTSNAGTPTLQVSTCATVGKVEVALKSYESGSEVGAIVNNGLARILTCTERSHGAVVSLQGNRVAVCWNCTKPCPTHVENSLVFVKMLGVSAGLGGEASIHVGMSTSTIFHGTVGDKRQKFVTVLGTGVVVSSSLCSDAVAKDVLCYYISPFLVSEMEGLSITEEDTQEAPNGTALYLQQVSCVAETTRTSIASFGSA